MVDILSAEKKVKLVKCPDDRIRYFLDIGIKEVRETILTRAISNAKSLGANVLNLDNWNYKSFGLLGKQESYGLRRTWFCLNEPEN